MAVGSSHPKALTYPKVLNNTKAQPIATDQAFSPPSGKAISGCPSFSGTSSVDRSLEHLWPSAGGMAWGPSALSTIVEDMTEGVVKRVLADISDYFQLSIEGLIVRIARRTLYIYI